MSDVHGAVGSYVVHGLGDQERAGFERHLVLCPACQVEVRELRETVAELSRLVDRPPPGGLRRQVLGGVRGHRPLPPQPPAAAGDGPTRAASPSLRRPRRGRRPLLTLALTLVLALVLAGAVVASAHQLQLVQLQRENRLLTAGDVQVHRTVVAGGHPVTLLVSRSEGRALFVGADLPAPGTHRRYQVWTQDRAGALTPGPTFDFADRERVWLTSGISDAVAVALTVEPRGGSPRPTTRPETVASF